MLHEQVIELNDVYFFTDAENTKTRPSHRLVSKPAYPTYLHQRSPHLPSSTSIPMYLCMRTVAPLW